MKAYEKELKVKFPLLGNGLLQQFSESVLSNMTDDEVPIRFAVTQSDESGCKCEIGVLNNHGSATWDIPSIFEFNPRLIENTKEFNAVLLVPTGIGAEIGGHAGDATPVARLLGSVCDNLITHPNVVNASDINEMPENTMYVEGSVITRFLMGTVGLAKVRANRLLAVIEDHPVDELFTNAAINSVNAARATLGLECADIVKLSSELSLSADYTSSGSASGHVENLDKLCGILKDYSDEYDAVAIASIIKVPREYHAKYFRSKGNMVNPWGGAEAIFTHTLSSLFNKPVAHSPMLEDQLIANFDPGVVDARLAAEAISLAFLQCILKGLHKAPKVITNKEAMNHHGVYTSADISCLVIPDGILGLPVLAALEQNIKVIAVKENKNLMKNNLSLLPWKKGQFIQVDNYFEALGVMSAIRSGLSIESIRRPMRNLTGDSYLTFFAENRKNMTG